jgi:hypothetical protein
MFALATIKTGLLLREAPTIAFPLETIHQDEITAAAEIARHQHRR